MAQGELLVDILSNLCQTYTKWINLKFDKMKQIFLKTSLNKLKWTA